MQILLFGKITGLTGLEPATSAVTGRCSNQLNYNPKKCLYVFFKLGERGIRTLGTDKPYNRLAI